MCTKEYKMYLRVSAIARGVEVRVYLGVLDFELRI